MSETLRNTPTDFARRLYALVPEHYRAYDAEEDPPLPLAALLAVIGEQVSHVRTDIDALWDDLFVETCADWVVPYLGALVGTNLLPRADERSIRRDVRNTVTWRRRKGTPAVLREVAEAMSGWPADRITEFFASLGWSQNVNHLRMDHPLTADLRDGYALSLLGRAADPFAHAADFRAGSALDGPRVTPDGLGVGRFAWGSPGRYRIDQIGVSVRRLQTFRVSGVTPAGVAPGPPSPADAGCFTFDPLHREAPLFVEATAEPISREAFEHAPWAYVGEEIGVRQHGVLLPADAPPLDGSAGAQAARSWDLTAGPTPVAAQPGDPFTFGGGAAGLTLDAARGVRLLNRRDVGPGGPHFVVSAEWWDDATATATPLGSVATLTAAYAAGVATSGAGQLRIVVRTGRAGLGFPGLPASPPGRFPGAVVSVMRATAGIPRAADAIHVALPAAFVGTADAPAWYVADDGGVYATPALTPVSLERGPYGEVYPARALTASVRPASDHSPPSRGPGGMRLPDPGRYGSAALLVQAEVFSLGAPAVLGAVATVDRVITDHPALEGPDAWPARTYRRSRAVLDDDDPPGKLAVRIRTLSGSLAPRCEVIIRSRAGRSLLVYLPELDAVPAGGQLLLVADDGSTWFEPADPLERIRIADPATSLDGLRLARASAGQIVPLPGAFPAQHRVPVTLDLCDCDRRGLLLPGEIGVDPERGRFALAPGDPAQGSPDLTVDYVEAFADRVGARTFARRIDPAVAPTRFVASTGDVGLPGTPLASIHTTLEDALAAAGPDDVIEIVDSATYRPTAALQVKAGLTSLTIRAAQDQRPCVATFDAAGAPLAAGLVVAEPLTSLELSGLLMSGGPVRVEAAVDRVALTGCTLDPATAGGGGSLVADDADPLRTAAYLLCRSIVGGIRVAAGVGRLTVADSIVDAAGGVAVGPVDPADPVRAVQLERATVWGRVGCVELHASESILDDLVVVEDRQVGCVRYSRYERGSTLPRRFACVPTGDQLSRCPPARRCLAPVFDSRRFGRPDYARLAVTSPPAIAAASEVGSEVGAFASGRSVIRLENLELKLREFLPAGLSALVLAET